MFTTVGAQATAVVTGSFLSGAMMSLSLIAVPVLLDTTTTNAPQLFHQWARMYHYGRQMMPTAAIATFLLYSYTCIKKRGAKKPWGVFLLAGVTTLSILPFTWLVMMSTNNELFRLERVSEVETEAGAGPLVNGVIDEAKDLVAKWSWLHFIRSLLPLVGAIIGTVGTFVGK